MRSTYDFTEVPWGPPPHTRSVRVTAEFVPGKSLVALDDMRRILTEAIEKERTPEGVAVAVLDAIDEAMTPVDLHVTITMTLDRGAVTVTKSKEDA